jgi:hypothetical protein
MNNIPAMPHKEDVLSLIATANFLFDLLGGCRILSFYLNLFIVNQAEPDGWQQSPCSAGSIDFQKMTPNGKKEHHPNGFP